jgi:mevalonate pyrophosphate decarboxylase
MEKTIYNLVSNSLGYEFSPFFVNALIKEMTNEEIIELAREEIQKIQYFVRIELPDWNYWKDKEQKLIELIIKLKNEKDTL